MILDFTYVVRSISSDAKPGGEIGNQAMIYLFILNSLTNIKSTQGRTLLREIVRGEME